MKYVVAHLMIGGQIHWEDLSQSGLYGGKEVGLQISFPLSSRSTEREAKKYIAKALKQNESNWLIWDKPNWLFSSTDFKKKFPSFKDEDWLTGRLIAEPEFETKRNIVFGEEKEESYLRFIITPEEVEDQMPKRIFLSHKGIDKLMVRRFKKALEVLNYSPWLDEDDMQAGIELERGLLKGFSDSCAAVFFITPNYADENFLATEINYAIQEKRSKGNKFSIITLVFCDVNGIKGEVPNLLKPYVWKEAESEISAITEIIRALPIQSPPPIWKHHG